MNNVSELNKAKVRLFVQAVWNEGRLDLIDELVAADYLGHVPCSGSAVTGPEGVRRLVASRRRAHPGLHVKIEDQIAEEDRVVTRWRATTTAPAAAGPAAPAEVNPCCAGISVVRLLAGRQVDSRTQCTRVSCDRPAGPAMSTESRAPGP